MTHRCEALAMITRIFMFSLLFLRFCLLFFLEEIGRQYGDWKINRGYGYNGWVLIRTMGEMEHNRTCNGIFMFFLLF